MSLHLLGPSAYSMVACSLEALSTSAIHACSRRLCLPGPLRARRPAGIARSLGSSAMGSLIP